MRNFLWIIALAVGWTLAGCGGAAPEAEAPQTEQAEAQHPEPADVEAQEMDVAEVKQRLESGEEVFLLDVRNPDELVEHGKIEGAVNIPIDELEARLDEVPKDTPIVTYCMRGGRASTAAATLREAGYEAPIEYGGITAWKEAGYEVVQPE